MTEINRVLPETYIEAAVSIDLNRYATDSQCSVPDYQGMLAQLERSGLLTIIYMDAGMAIVCWHAKELARGYGVPFARRVTS